MIIMIGRSEEIRRLGWVCEVEIQNTEWESQARPLYIKKHWGSLCPSLEPEKKNIQHSSLVKSSKMLLPPLHIKLGLMKYFVKAFDKQIRSFHSKLPALNEASIKECAFTSHQICEVSFRNSELTLHWIARRSLLRKHSS